MKVPSPLDGQFGPLGGFGVGCRRLSLPQDQFASNIASTVHWRWNSIVNALESLIRKKSILQQLWSAERFTQRRAAAEDVEPANVPESARQLNVKILDHTIRNSAWWAFSHMVLEIHAIAKEFGQWGESCPCHDVFRSGSGALHETMRREMETCRAQCLLASLPAPHG